MPNEFNSSDPRLPSHARDSGDTSVSASVNELVALSGLASALSCDTTIPPINFLIYTISSLRYALAFAPSSVSGSLASSDHENVCIVPCRLLSTFNTVALLGLSTTPNTRSRSLASGAQLVLDHLNPKDNQWHHLILRSSSSTTTPTSRPAPTLLLLYIPLNSANSVPESVNPALTSSTSPPPFKNVSPRAQRAYGFFSSPTPPPPCTE
ncbi:hypothetical protein DFP72DRAFT_1059609 [Ephemerocybe angulata]|uniref:Uncharacterized protein n=1 Tax=Ephemerocybe angulata TaxID=980116 RepID=A0A8H6MBV9_9AGAR|nr:hypothetical protein DFP72DRAFT_1059609 [Tulosesus angulatus]